VQGIQASFAEDWFWATGEVLDLNWQVTRAEFMNATVLILPTGPADRLQNCSLFFATALMQAQTRLWIASPYFVPDEVLVNALQAAAIRGVHVRILIPDRPDHLLVFLASFSYYAEMEAAGVKLYRYNQGFMHQKVLLIDDQIAAIGTVNLDNRSFQLNFEISAFILDNAVIAGVQEMLEKDFLNAVQVDKQEYEQKSIGFKVLVQVSRLLAPIL
jgi:cardiolipin synthase